MSLRIPGRPTVLCVGVTPCLQRTLRFERFAVHQVNRAHAVSIQASGKGTNVCRALGTLGDSPVLATMIGGPNGARFSALLEDEGLAIQAVPVSGETRICQTLLDEASGEVTELVEEMPSPSPDEWRAFDACLEALLLDAAVLVLSGRLPPGSPRDVYARWCEAAASHGVPVCIDSQREPLAEAVGKAPLLVKINAEELAATYPGPEDAHPGLQSGIDRLRAEGAEWVLITRGAKPSLLVGPGQSWQYRIPVLDAVNPIGSGDSTLAGTVRGLRQGLSMPEAARFGLAAGCANALTESPAEFDPAAVAGLVDRIEMNRVL